MRKPLVALASIAAIGVALPALAHAQDLGSLGSAGGSPVVTPTVTDVPDPITTTQMVPSTITTVVPTTITELVPTTVSETVTSTVPTTITSNVPTTITTTVPRPPAPAPGELDVYPNASADGLHYSVRFDPSNPRSDAAYTTLQYRAVGNSEWKQRTYPLDTPQALVTDPDFIFGITYEFRVRQLLDDNQVTEWTATETLTNERTYPPAAPFIGFDTDDGTSPTQLVVWASSQDRGLVCSRQSDAGAVHDCPGNGQYEAQTSNSVNFADPVSQVVSSAHFDRTLPPRNEWYIGDSEAGQFTYYRIRAIDLWGNVSSWSNVLGRSGTAPIG